MKFLKQNSYDIVKLYINQIGITIFSLIMYTAGGMIKEGGGISLSLQVGISVFSTLFYFVLIYTAAWDWGAKDKIRIEGGRINRDSFKGLKMSAMANSINAILTLVMIIFGAFASGFATSAYSVASMFSFLTMSMYHGITRGVLSLFTNDLSVAYRPLLGLGYLLLAIVSILVTHMGYRFGLKEKKIFSFKKNK